MEADRIEIEFFSGFVVRRDGEQLRNLGINRIKVLQILASDPGRPCSPRELTGGVWPDKTEGPSDESSLKKSLRREISDLRRDLEPGLESGPDSRYIRRDSRGYYFDPQSPCWIDTVAFSEHHRRGQRLRDEGHPEEAIEQFTAVAALYTGDFLAGWDDSWIDNATGEGHRDHYREKYRLLMQELITLTEEVGRLDDAIRFCVEADRHFPHTEEFLRRRKQLYETKGDRVAAASVEQELEERRREYGIDP